MVRIPEPPIKGNGRTIAATAPALDVAALDQIPDELVKGRQWIAWRSEGPDARKMPRTIDGSNASSTNPATWSTYIEALEAFEQAPAGQDPFTGIGRVFAGDDFCTGIDLDDSLDDQGELLPWAAEIVNELASYAEVSPSGKGVKIWIRGRLDADGKERKGKNFKRPGGGGIEIYDRGRYFTVTGRKLPSAPSAVVDGQAAIIALYDRLVALNAPPARLPIPNPPARNGVSAMGARVRWRKYVETMPDAVSGNNGHDRTFTAACECFRFGMSDAEAWDAMNWFNGNKCSPPWPDRALQHKIDDARKEVDKAGDTGKRLNERVAKKAINGKRLTPPPANGPANQNGARPNIVIDTEEHRVIAETVAALAVDRTIFHRGGILVRAQVDEQPNDGILRVAGSPTIQRLPAPTLRERMTQHVRFVKFNREGEEIPAHPPSWLVSAIDVRGEWPGIRPLLGVSNAPILRADGSIHQEAGYDDRTGVIFVPSSTEAFPAIESDVGLDDAHGAADRLLEVICDFPFEEKIHQAAALAALLTPVARFAYTGPTPLFLCDANVRAAGKGLLLQVCGRIALGREMPVSSYSHDASEMRKRITACAIAGDRVILLDNLDGVFGNDALDRALTSTLWKDRILGKSEEVELPLLATWYATGNNVAVAADTARRIIHIRLDAMTERPEERTDFKHSNLLSWVTSNRGALLADALTILAAYCRAGRPSHRLTPYGSFEGWSDLVREAIVWVGLPDPCLTRTKLAEASDTTADALAQLISAWKDYYSSEDGVLVSEMLCRLYPVERKETPTTPKAVAMRAALENLVGCPSGKTPSTRQVGNRLRSFRRRIVGGRYLDISGTSHHAAAWKLIDSTGGESGESGESVLTTFARELCI